MSQLDSHLRKSLNPSQEVVFKHGEVFSAGLSAENLYDRIETAVKFITKKYPSAVQHCDNESAQQQVSLEYVYEQKYSIRIELTVDKDVEKDKKRRELLDQQKDDFEIGEQGSSLDEELRQLVCASVKLRGKFKTHGDLSFSHIAFGDFKT